MWIILADISFIYLFHCHMAFPPCPFHSFYPFLQWPSVAAPDLFSMPVILSPSFLHRVTCLLTGGLIRQLKDGFLCTIIFFILHFLHSGMHLQICPPHLFLFSLQFLFLVFSASSLLFLLVFYGLFLLSSVYFPRPYSHLNASLLYVATVWANSWNGSQQKDQINASIKWINTTELLRCGSKKHANWWFLVSYSQWCTMDKTKKIQAHLGAITNKTIQLNLAASFPLWSL